MLNLVLFGPPGAGKGTQAEFLINTFNLIHISTGELLRSEIAAGTELGKIANQFMAKGELVSDDVVIEMIKGKINDNPEAKGFIFDGFPRTVDQAVALDRLLNEKGTPVSAMLCLEVEKEELINRLLGRGKISGRADDQSQKIIENRIEVYRNKTEPIIEYYSEQNKHHDIKGMGTIEEIAERLIKKVESLYNKQM
ncbi:adenylate kinase [Maribellus sediminis]|uniref:adenylate kinase n=1 Tax=Maribellus sediminis TaxID=2696285 RepID=UPI001430DED6|nr:adenylate kinase [Maribellus sediminis]